MPVWIERGSLHLPPQPITPVIMVGPGTGVAPFRAFMQEREAIRAAETEQQGQAWGNSGSTSAGIGSCLVFGCRNEVGDFFWQEEWRAWQQSGLLAPGFGVITAFSRDQPRKVYVQHKIAEHSAALWGLLQHGAYIYVAGSADKMPADVAKAFVELVAKEGDMSAEQAKAYVRQLEVQGRYQVEVWS